MKTKFFLLVIVMALALIVGCSEQNNIISSSQGILQTVWVNPDCVELFAGQNIDAGDICYDIVNNELCVTFNTTYGWELTEVHLWVGEDLTGMPQTKKGNPQIGLFPYQSGDVTGATTFTFCIPVESLNYVCDDIFFLAAHAALRMDLGGGNYQVESGWGDGVRMVDRGNWATYFSIMINCSNNPPNYVTCETSYGYGGTDATCFLDIDLDGGFFNWGWSNGPLIPGVYTYNIFAGAGDCLILNGTLVGTLTINYDGSTATVTYTMDSGFLLDETHLHVGNGILPLDSVGDPTIAPARFPFIHDNLDGVGSDTFIINNLSGNIYVVAHAIVCGTL